ncbi:MAG: alpha-N-arabinofuranosidase, partial [Anaerolineae bacterium]|nr:alpha-N-arabinofuranosidase [Anaerolineae bacterium]
RSQTDSITIELNWQDAAPSQVVSAYQLSGTDPKAANSFENPNRVVSKAISAPAIEDGKVTLVVPPLSFTTLDVRV